MVSIAPTPTASSPSLGYQNQSLLTAPNGVVEPPVFPGVASVVGNATSGSLTGTTSTTYIMAGIGALGWTLTPAYYSTARVKINGQITNGTTADGANIILAYGTGTAPANGTALTGTTVGVNTIYTALTGQLTQGVPFSKEYIITGLTPGTAYWFDLQLKAITGGTASVINVEYSAQELSN